MMAADDSTIKCVRNVFGKWACQQRIAWDDDVWKSEGGGFDEIELRDASRVFLHSRNNVVATCKEVSDDDAPEFYCQSHFDGGRTTRVCKCMMEVEDE